MNTMDLLELIGQTPDKYVLDVADPVKKRIPAKRIGMILNDLQVERGAAKWN